MIQYKCLKIDFADLTKKVNYIGKKLDRNNLKWKFKKIAENIEEIKINGVENILEVVTYTFEMENLKIGEYEAIAVIDHKFLNNGVNLIYTLKEGITIPEKYRTIKCNCQHCNSNRKRNKTILLQDKQGKIIQVGTTCIKDFTGIEAKDIIKNYTDIYKIILSYNNLEVNNTYYIKDNKYTKTKNYLANCIELIKKEGYKKENTKNIAWENRNKKSEYIKEAEEVINYFKNNEFKNNEFINNVKENIINKYTRKSGFIAYAYVLYKKIAKKKNKTSEYVGNVKDRIKIEVLLIDTYVYESTFGLMYINLYKDKKGNVYKWNSKNIIETENEEYKIIKATIKDHKEYNGEKQTIITRCKLVN